MPLVAAGVVELFLTGGVGGIVEADCDVTPAGSLSCVMVPVNTGMVVSCWMQGVMVIIGYLGTVVCLL